MTNDQRNRALAEAMRLAEHGYALTPVTLTRSANGKKHARFHTGWRHEAGHSADREQVRAWWVDHSDTSFAIVCGASGIEAVDLDVKPAEGVDAVTWWAEQGLPAGALIQTTPTGGLHHVWRVRGDGLALPQEAGRSVGRGVDTRNRAGLLFAAGSYIVGEPGQYEVLGELRKAADLAETPRDVLDLFEHTDQRDSAARPADGRIVEHDEPWQREQVARALAAVREHRRDQGGYRAKLQHAALFLGRRVEQGHMTAAAAKQECLDAHRAAWGPEVWPENVKDVRDGLRDGPKLERWRTPRVATPLRVVQPGDGAPDNSPAPDARPAEPAGLARFLLPAEVWEFSPLLRHVHAAAMARLVSPDTLLHALLAVTASLLHHDSRVETGKGSSPLSYYVAPIGASGAGKSQAVAVARELLAEWAEGPGRFAITGNDGFVDAPLGSGEGLIEAFMGEQQRTLLDHDGSPLLDKNGHERTERVRTQVRHNGLFVADEGRQVLAIDSRKGATVLAVLCEMWSGATAGQTNAEAARTRKLKAGTYVIGLIAGFQVATIDALFADEAGGTPQRFVFAPAEYAPFAEIDDDQDDPEWPGELTLDVPITAVTVHLTPEQRREVRRAIRAKAAGRSDEGPLDGHRMLIRCRLAALLALIHGTTEVDSATWDLARLLVGRSCALRDWLAVQGQRKAEEKRRAQQDAAVETTVRAQATAQQHERVVRAAGQLARAVENAGGTLTRGRALNGIRSDLRDVRDLAVERAVALGMVELSEDGKTISMPSLS